MEDFFSTTSLENIPQPKIGVYICHCGQNIASKVKIDELVSFASKLKGVEISRDYKFMCSEPGQNLIRDDIRSGKIDRVLVASCSPLMHEGTFRKTASDEGLNPFMLQMANIREHVSWVTSQTEKATSKAKVIISAGVARLRMHKPLPKRILPVRQEVAVIGGGVAGLTAALAIADAGKKVFIIEKEPTVGGHMGYFDKTFPTLDCAACTLTPRMVRAGAHPNIKIFSMTEVVELKGRAGEYTLTLLKKPRYINEEKCNGCGECWNSCPAVRVPSKRLIKLGGKIVR